MEFRECRLVTLHRIFKEIDPTIELTKSFLFLGGIKIALYKFPFRKNELIGLNGSGEMNSPYIFDELEIIYETIDSQTFFSEYFQNREKYLYILPLLGDFLGVEKYDTRNISVTGQSYLMIDDMDEQKIYFEFQGTQEFLMKSILEDVAKKQVWLLNGEFYIYKICKRKLQENLLLRKKLEIAEEELLLTCLNNYFSEFEYISEEGLVRVEGLQTFEQIIDYFKKLKMDISKYNKTKNKNNYRKYIYLQMLHMQKLICGGTDAFFRNEFKTILEKYYLKNDDSAIIKNKWINLAALWRDFARKLQNNISYNFIMKQPEKVIDMIIDYLKKIALLEVDVMKETNALFMKK